MFAVIWTIGIGIGITLHTLLRICVLLLLAVAGTGGTSPSVSVGTQRAVTGVGVLVLGHVTVGALAGLGPRVLSDRRAVVLWVPIDLKAALLGGESPVSQVVLEAHSSHVVVGPQ